MLTCSLNCFYKRLGTKFLVVTRKFYQHSCEIIKETSNIPVVSPSGVREGELNNFIFPLSFHYKEEEKACAALTGMKRGKYINGNN